MIRLFRVLFLLTLLVLATSQLDAQVATGTPPFGSFDGSPDVINLANLNAHWTIPIRHKAGRGLDFSFDVTYDSSIWYPVGVSGSQIWTPVTGFGWGGFEPLTGTISYNTSTQSCLDLRGRIYHYSIYSAWVFTDPLGVKHRGGNLTVTAYNDVCEGTPPYPDTATYTYPDASGYTITVYADPSATVVASTGTTYNPPTPTTTATATDRNGNQLTHDSSGHYYDTLSSTIPVVTVGGLGTPASPTKFTYAAPLGATPAYVMNYAPYTVQTAFNCNGISEYGPTPSNLVSEIDLPDGSKYTFSYEQTPGVPANVTGRLASVTLPAGGKITYAYTDGKNAITCADGSTATLTRTTPDGIWTYAQVKNSGAASTTTIKDPSTAANQTVIQFQGIYETQRQVYQGSTSGTLLVTTNTCYNGSASPCNSTAIIPPITQRSAIAILPGSKNLQSKHVDFYNTYGLQTESDDYDYGTGSPGAALRKVLTVYTSLSNGIVDRPASVTVQDGTGTTIAKTTYAYDQNPLGSTTGTPQHINFSGSHGNATTISYLVAGSTNLSKTISYFDTGNVYAFYDVNNANIEYGPYTCGNAFATLITESILLSKSETWDCTGGVSLSIKDENGQTTAASYTDPNFWRPYSITDPAVALTTFTYPTASPYTSVESKLSFNSGNSVVDSLATIDGLGRQLLSQTRQGPSSPNFDSVEQDYDSLGRPSRATVPFSATSGQQNSSAPATTTSYDALGRVLQVLDAGGGSATYSYLQNDVYVTIGPQPTGENTKRRQLEYDGLGRLTSVCELSSGSGGSCGQNTAYGGYWTKYTYNSLGSVLTVTQNAQAATGSQQTRSFTYDSLNRLTSETNPENGSTRYFYDTAPSTPGAACSGTYNGDLVKRYDAVGNTTCYQYDGLHRLTAKTYAGPYASNTLNKYFVYDTAIVNGVTLVNTKARLAEAYTSTSPTGTKSTDIGFSYTVRGEVSDVYQSTPHSGTYYHFTETYWAHGVPNQLSSNISTLPAFTYGVDAQGRPNSTSASSGIQNPVTGVTYSPYASPPQLAVNFGSSDSDVFSFDASTGRMTQYQFNVNGQSDKGTLTWNANATLQKLAIVDAFNSTDTQTCTYSYDDLSRLGSANCGTGMNQAFSYDAFGNISKSGTFSFLANYNTANNRITSVGGYTPTYDSNGNVLNDGMHSYTWDAEGRPVIADGVALTYDALNRMVEQNRSSVYTEIAYAPTGEKLALLTGTTLQKAFIPLPGSAKAVYTSSGLDHYRHADWLGSTRLTSTPSRTVSSTLAYAPFGEVYAQLGTPDFSFTGQNQDTAPGLNDFLYREYSSQARWPSPDPAGLAAVDPTNPQSLNRYAYVMNDPDDYTDPLGLKRGGLPPLPPGCWWVSDDPPIFDCVSLFGGPGNCVNININGIYIGTACTPVPTTGPGGRGNGGRSGGGHAPTVLLSPQAQACVNQAQSDIFRQLQVFAGYSGAKLTGRMAIGAGMGAISVARWTKYGGPWGMAAGAAIGSSIGAFTSAWQDKNTIQGIQATFMNKVQTCLQESAIPSAPPL